MTVVLQLVYSGVLKDIWLCEEVILIFLDIFLQHLQPAIAQPAQWPCRLGVIFILNGRVEGTVSGHCLSLAMTSEFAKHLDFLKLRQGTGTCSCS